MNIREILAPESVILGLTAGSKEEIIRRLVDVLPLSEGAESRADILSAVLEREKVMSTGIGRGVAIPHAKTEHVKGIMAAVAVAGEPVPFEAIDGQPCRIFFLVVSDPGTTSPHIRALSHISRILNDKTHKEALENAATTDEVFEALELAED